jgi:hypothetical protein
LLVCAFPFAGFGPGHQLTKRDLRNVIFDRVTQKLRLAHLPFGFAVSSVIVKQLGAELGPQLNCPIDQWFQTANADLKPFKTGLAKAH